MPVSDDPLDVGWTELLQHWDADERHKAFIALASTMQRLPDAAARYRSAESDPTLAAGAALGKRLLLTHALAHIDNFPRTSPDAARRGGRILAPIVALAMLITGSFVLRALTHKSVFASLPVLALEIAAVALLPWQRFLR